MQLLSPKQVAKSIGVSESSLKRWCDQGLIRTEKTPGGHRRMLVGDVISFLRRTDRPILDPQILGLPPGVGRGAPLAAKSEAAFQDALINGNGERCRQLVLDRYVSGANVVEICDELLAPAMHRVGELWQCGNAEIFQERLACEIISQLVHDLRTVLPTPAQDAPMAIGCSPAGDIYRLPTLMVQMALIEAGWQAVSLGENLPYDTILAAVRERNPSLLWISVSTAGKDGDVVGELAAFAEKLPDDVAMIAGGRALESAGIEAVPGVEIGKGLRDLQRHAERLLSPADGSTGKTESSAADSRLDELSD